MMEYHPDRNQNREKEIIPIFKPPGRTYSFVEKRPASPYRRYLRRLRKEQGRPASVMAQTKAQHRIFRSWLPCVQ